MAVILIAIGLLFTGVDIHVVSGIAYPEFQVTGMLGKYELAPSIRTYTLTNVLGDHVRIDCLPDIIGYVLIFIGVCKLLRYNKQYWYSLVMLVLAVISSVLLRSCGFITQDSSLVVWIMVCFFAQLAAELFMEYLVIYSTIGITDALVNRGTNIRILFGWWLTVICRVYMAFLTFVGHTGVNRVYRWILVAAVLFCVITLIRTRKYVGTAETIDINTYRKREHKEKL